MKPRTFLLATLMLLVQASAFADGGAVQLRKVAGAFVITLLASPAPLTAGPVDISVLLQDRDGLEPVLDANVSLFLREETSGAQIKVRATREQTQTNPLYAAPLTLDAPGKWRVAVKISQRGGLHGDGGSDRRGANPCHDCLLLGLSCASSSDDRGFHSSRLAHPAEGMIRCETIWS